MMVAPTARVDLTNCDTEPIHIPGSIQPHGVLLAVNETSTTVEVASGNVEELLGLPLSAILGAPLSAALGDGAASAVRAHAKVAGLGAEGAGVPLRLEHGLGRAAWTGLSVEAVMHRSSGLLVVELEPDAGGGSSTPLSHRSTRVALNHLATTTTVRDLAQVLATEVRTLTAHDRVMVYRFDADWNGEVIAEDRREDLEPFLDFTTPPPTSRSRHAGCTRRAGPGSSPTSSTGPVPWSAPVPCGSRRSSTSPWRCCAASPPSTSST